MKRFRWLSVAIFFIVVSSLIPLAFSGTVQADSEKGNLKELTDGADSIVVGTVVERSSYWNDEHTRIYTSVVMSVEDRLKGEAGPDKVTITVPGGDVEGIGEFVSEMPSFDQGEKAVVFLKKQNNAQPPKAMSLPGEFPAQQFEVYQGFRGKFPIKGDKIDSLPVASFKGRINSILSGQALPATELDITPSLVTMPYLYAGYSWPHPPAPVVPYRINENTADCGGEGAAVQTAASTWNVPANFSFSYTGATAATGYSYDGVNEVLWKDFGGGGTIAHAIIWYSGSTILENDIEFNDYYSWSAAASCPGGQFDVETIALHELGHWLCLSDLYDPADSAKVMYGYGSTGTTKRALTADDIAGIRYIYGTSSVIPPTVTNSTGASNITSTSARLNGELTSNGNADTTVHIYWGDNDAGTTPTGQPGGWDNDVNLGIKPIGTLYTDISGLTNGTAYYYRCFATNSAGSAWASSTASFTTLSGSATRYEYYDGSEGISSVYSSFWSAQTFIPSTAHKITSVKVKFFKVGLPPGTLTVGIRNTDASGHPTGSDLCSGTIPGSNFTTSNTGSWEEISLGSGYDLSASTKYAIVCRLTGGNGSNMVCCVGNWTNPQYSGGNYEHSGSGGSSWTYYNYDMAFEDWGTPSAPPTPPSPPALLSPGAAITFKWGTSTGATTYWLQVNTASDFTGINLFNAEVGNVTSQEVTGLSLGTTYYWRVKAGNSGGWSAWSSVRSVLANTMP